MSYYDYERQIFSYLEGVKNLILTRPLMLGGVAASNGGGGGPPGGFVGYLPQNRVAYDLSELATLAVLPSSSLIDNLNHIRYRLQTLENASGESYNLIIKDDGTFVASGITVIDFIGANVNVTAIPDGVTVTISSNVGSGDVATDTIWNAKGDLVVGTGTDTASILPVGTNTYVLTADSTEATGLKWTLPSGGGSGAPTNADYIVETANAELSAESVLGVTVVTSTTLSNRQAAAKAGRLFLPSNASYIQRDTGTAWTSWGPIHPITPPPTIADFTWFNQQTATAVDSGGAIYFKQPTIAQWCGTAKAGASNPFTLTVAITYNDQNNDAQSGIGIRDSVSGKIETLTVDHYYKCATMLRWNSASSINSVVRTSGSGHNPALTWLQITEDSTTRKFNYSLDGITWTEIASEAKAAFVTPNQVCIGAYSNSGYIGFRIISWKEE